MADYSIVSTGSPIVPYTLDVTFEVNVTVTYQNQVQSNKSGAELNAQFQAYATDMENEIKTRPEFTVEDETRNATCSLDEDLTVTPQEGYTAYIATTTFTIENATILQQKEVQTELTGTEKDAFLAEFANGVESQFKSERNWVDL